MLCQYVRATCKIRVKENVAIGRLQMFDKIKTNETDIDWHFALISTEEGQSADGLSFMVPLAQRDEDQ